MQILARSLPFVTTRLSKRSTLLLPSAAITAAAVTAASETATTSCTIPALTEVAAILSKNELAELRNLLPSLCDTGHPLDAVRLLDAALLAAPPLSSLPLPDLTDRLCSLPDMTATMALLTALRFNPRRPSPLPFCAMMLSSYFRRRRLREAAKVFAWLCRADSPCRPDIKIYGIAVRGFCERARAFEAVRVAREMVRDEVVLTVDLRVLLCHALLREARVQEALDLDSAINMVGEAGDGHGDRIDGVVELLDSMIKDWED
ncbi:hypothetical protein KSP40_PGU015628 [Platanthera guangdongensis]|uniref:Pentatricopeptide repeat-containing protein n=1 Tax=Platanthera guangdongensis TaxID=2320717 RepID=A0ABR2MRU1_9ASPA